MKSTSRPGLPKVRNVPVEMSQAQLAELMRTLYWGGERESAIVGATLIDDLVRKMLQQKLLPPLNVNDDLLDKALGDFSDRIDLAYRLHLIDKDFADVLHIIRKVRNRFAHASVMPKLDEPGFREALYPFIEMCPESLDAYNDACHFQKAFEQLRKAESPVELATDSWEAPVSSGYRNLVISTLMNLVLDDLPEPLNEYPWIFRARAEALAKLFSELMQSVRKEPETSVDSDNTPAP